MLISDDKLLIIRNSKKQVFQLNHISYLKTENKKILFPLILGGIITPFAFLSYFVNPFFPWIHLVLVLFGLFILYIGWSGKSSLTLVSKNGDEFNYYLPSISRNLCAFIEFVNSRLKEPGYSGKKDFVYFVLEKDEVDLLFSRVRDSKNSSLFPLFGYTYHQVKIIKRPTGSKILVAINPLKAGIEIRFSFDMQTKQMRPILEGPISKESKVDNFDNE